MKNKRKCTFGYILKDLRLGKGKRQKDVARGTGLNASAISHFESGRRLPSYENLCRLILYFDCDPAYLLMLG